VTTCTSQCRIQSELSRGAPPSHRPSSRPKSSGPAVFTCVSAGYWALPSASCLPLADRGPPDQHSSIFRPSFHLCARRWAPTWWSWRASSTSVRLVRVIGRPAVDLLQQDLHAIYHSVGLCTLDILSVTSRLVQHILASMLCGEGGDGPALPILWTTKQMKSSEGCVAQVARRVLHHRH
jgi:hypothetical protein